MSEKKPKNILVISLQGIGDLLLTTPLLHTLKSEISPVKVSVLTFDNNKAILNGNPDIEEVITFNSKDSNNPWSIIRLLTYLRRNKYDLSIGAYPCGLRSAFMGYASGAKERLGQGLSIFRNYRWLFTKQINTKEVKHAVLINLDFLDLLGIRTNPLNAKVVLNLSDEEMNDASCFLESQGAGRGDLIVAIHVGGGKPAVEYKSWPIERFSKVADILTEKCGAKIVFIGGSSDIGPVDIAARAMTNKPVIAAGKLSLKSTAALLKKSKLLISNNSGPMHIAAAIGTPTVSISGPVDPRIHGPWGDGHIVLQSELDCSPCYYPFFRDTLEETKLRNKWSGKKFECMTGDYRCLSSITVEDVAGAAKKILER